VPLEEHPDQTAVSRNNLRTAIIAASLMAFLCSSVTAEEVVNSIGMRLVRIPAGEFLMGSSEGTADADADERPQHRVRISRPFLLGCYEVTQAEYQRVMGANPSWFSAQGGGREQVAGKETSRYPVDMVSWDDAVEFCRRLSDLPDEHSAGRTYRLPTEAEWEYACRAGSQGPFSSGDAITSREANIAGGRTLTPEEGISMPVGSFRSNAFGLYDMHGNVWEWCNDWYAFGYYQASPHIDPAGPESGTGHVVRGGDWHFGSRAARSANRDFTRATRRDLGNGFRVAVGQ
jgi:formylglycine-generating enzyme required for sulfatase activity